MRLSILVPSAVFALLFGGALAFSWLNPILIERAAREVVRVEVERRVGERVDTLSNARIVGLAQKALQQTDLETQRAQEAIRNEVPRRVANVMADMLSADCACRKRLVAQMERAEQERLSSLTQVRERLTGLIEATYASVSQSLMREFRVFTASNAAAFALLAVITLFRRRATLQLLLPALVLVGAVGITGGSYLFSQDWLHTLVFGEYVGLAYTLYLVGVALLLADVAVNRARVATRLVNSALSVVGSAASAAPC